MGQPDPKDVHKKGPFSVHVMQVCTGKRIFECMRNAWFGLMQDCLGQNAEILPMSAAIWVRNGGFGCISQESHARIMASIGVFGRARFA